MSRQTRKRRHPILYKENIKYIRIRGDCPCSPDVADCPRCTIPVRIKKTRKRITKDGTIKN